MTVFAAVVAVIGSCTTTSLIFICFVETYLRSSTPFSHSLQLTHAIGSGIVQRFNNQHGDEMSILLVYLQAILEQWRPDRVDRVDKV